MGTILRVDPGEVMHEAGVFAIEMRDDGFSCKEIARAVEQRFGFRRDAEQWMRWLLRNGVPLGSGTAQRARDLRDAGKSWATIARVMEARYGIRRHRDTWRYRVERVR